MGGYTKDCFGYKRVSGKAKTTIVHWKYRPDNGTKEPEFEGDIDCWICNVLSWSGDILLIGDNDVNSKLYDYDRQNQKCSSWGSSRGENGAKLHTIRHWNQQLINLNLGQRAGGSSPPLPTFLKQQTPPQFLKFVIRLHFSRKKPISHFFYS